MKQTIGCLKKPDQVITDVDVVFVALYNLLAEKLEQEPNKGIIVCKGQPNERKAKWGQVMAQAHMLEDFFIFRSMRVGDRICDSCRYFCPISKASPHMGSCKLHQKQSMHKLHCCKDWHSQDKALEVTNEQT